MNTAKNIKSKYLKLFTNRAFQTHIHRAHSHLIQTKGTCVWVFLVLSFANWETLKTSPSSSNFQLLIHKMRRLHWWFPQGRFLLLISFARCKPSQNLCWRLFSANHTERFWPRSSDFWFWGVLLDHKPVSLQLKHFVPSWFGLLGAAEPKRQLKDRWGLLN